MKRVLIFVLVLILVVALGACVWFFSATPDVDVLSSEEEADCKLAGLSADEYSFGKYIGPKKCCEGLVKIPVKEYEGGKCFELFDVGTVCSDCGNEVCEEWENACSCEKDCS